MPRAPQSVYPRLESAPDCRLIFGMSSSESPLTALLACYWQHWLRQAGAGPALWVNGFATPMGPAPAGLLPEGASSLLVQEDPVLAARLREAAPSASVLQMPLAEATGQITTRAEEATTTLVWLDPPAAVQLPLDAAAALANAPGTDVWLRVPTDQLRNLSRLRTVPVADLPPYGRRVVDGIGYLLGDARGAWLAEWRQVEAEQGSTAAQRRVAALFAARLANRAGGKSLKSVELRLADPEPMFLIGISEDPRRLLAMNAALEELELDDHVRWTGRRFRHAPPPPLAEPLDLFGLKPAPEARRVLDEAALASEIRSRFAGQELTWGEVLADLLLSDLLPDDAVQAMRALRKIKRAAYRSLKPIDAEVVFTAG